MLLRLLLADLQKGNRENNTSMSDSIASRVGSIHQLVIISIIMINE